MKTSFFKSKYFNIILCGIVFTVALFVLPRIIIFFSSNIAKLINVTAGKVLYAWKTASVFTPPVIPIFFGILFAVLKIIRNKVNIKGAKAVFAIFYVVIFVLGFSISLLYSKINSVPVFTVIKIVIGFM